jgi:hypothetical protein
MTPNFYVFDIETVPLPDDQLAEMDLGEAVKLGNLKDPEKIEAKRREHENRCYERAALSPLTGRVAAVGILGPNKRDLRVDFSEEEKLIRSLFDYFCHDNAGWWIGFNIAQFDLPFVVRRAWALGIQPPRWLVNGRYLSSNFIDLAQVWRLCAYEKELISLDRLARFLGLGNKDGSGAGFAQLLYADKAAARAYLEKDLFLTWSIAERFGLFAANPDEGEPKVAQPQAEDEGATAEDELVFW